MLPRKLILYCQYNKFLEIFKGLIEPKKALKIQLNITLQYKVYKGNIFFKYVFIYIREENLIAEKEI